MSVSDYVKQVFGEAFAKKLTKIRTGGDNNQKGTDFENFYAVVKICEIASSASNLDDYTVSSQELAFVDDLCVRCVNLGEKINYQAKNSALAAADWDNEMEERFRMQSDIDAAFHKLPNNQQILLVSSFDKAAANDAKIPMPMKAYAKSEFFPHANSPYQLFDQHAAARQVLEAVCDSKDLAVLDAAFRLVLGVWTAENDRPRSVGDLIGLARANSRPDIFGGQMPHRPGVPGWILAKCAALQGFATRVEFGNFIVSYNGLEVSIPSTTETPEPDTLAELDTPEAFLAFLMSIAAMTL